MRKIIVTMWVTLDGFIAGPNGEMDWIGELYDHAQVETATYSDPDASFRRRCPLLPTSQTII